MGVFDKPLKVRLVESLPQWVLVLSLLGLFGGYIWNTNIYSNNPCFNPRSTALSSSAFETFTTGQKVCLDFAMALKIYQ
jgi:hypothetical protein